MINSLASMTPEKSVTGLNSIGSLASLSTPQDNWFAAFKRNNVASFANWR
jgi:hypothetical protein